METRRITRRNKVKEETSQESDSVKIPAKNENAEVNKNPPKPHVESVLSKSSGNKMEELECNLNLRFDLLALTLLALSLSSRFYNLDQPHSIVFDELHYGRYASYYLRHMFFYDSHPPLGKQLVALAGHLSGYDGNATFGKIGAPYNSTVPVFAMRSVPAVCGSLLAPLAYLIMKLLGFSQITAGIAGFLFLFDNALLTQSHYILMEPILLVFALLGLYCILRFRLLCRERGSSYTLSWWTWLISGGFFLSCAVCVKYAGIYSLGLGLSLVAYDFWNDIVGDLTMTRSEMIKHGLARTVALVALPVGFYIGVFYVHLAVLTHAGPHDTAMSTAFQASLEGGLGSILRGQPLEVVHGSQITLRHTHGIPCWLHGQMGKYPVRYPDKRGSSHQQIVSCHPLKDVGNWWIVKRPNRSDLLVEIPLDKIQHGDVVQLVHGLSGRNLNSHNVAAPSSPTKQEVSCYIDLNVSMPAMDLWRVDITNREEVGNTWHAVQSLVRLIHVNTSAALSFTGRSLPPWGNSEHEIGADPMINHQNTIFNVEEHRYTRNEDENERQADLHLSEFVPLEPTKLSFLEKFIELQLRMLFISNENMKTHMYTSSPWDWLTLTKGIAYWISSDSNAQIHLLGNYLIWYSATAALAVYCALLLFYLLRQRRQCYDIPPEAWRQFKTTGEVLFLGYCFHFVPYFFVDYALFLHHYLPALAFKLMITAAVVEHLQYLIKKFISWKLATAIFNGALLFWMAGVVFIFEKYTPLCYGTGPMNASDIQELKLKETWDFIIHKS